jgi:peptidylprolyl isomerase
MRRTLIVLTVLAALAAGCGEDEATRDTGDGSTTTAAPDLASTNVDDVEVTGAEGEQPTLTFDMPFGVEETVTRVLTEGDGPAIEPNAVATFDFLFVNGRDGTVLGSSYEAEPQELVVEESLMPGIFNGLNGVTAGSRVLIAMAPADGAGADEESGVRDTDTLLFFAEVHEVRIPLPRAEGTAVAPVAGHPTVELADDGAPTITLPGGEPPAALVAQPLIEGTGAVVESGQSITVHYTGVLWDGGTVFDSSWDRGTPATFEIGTGGVIPGWDEGLVGRTVGSQVLLVIPPDKGYGETGSGETIPPGATLVFVVDILDAA